MAWPRRRAHSTTKDKLSQCQQVQCIDRFPEMDPHRKRVESQSTCKSTFERRKEAVCAARLSLIPPKSTPAPPSLARSRKIPQSHLPPYLPPSLIHRPSSIQRPLLSLRFSWVVGSRSVPLWTSIHPVHAAKQRERERDEGGQGTRVYRVNLDGRTTCARGQTRHVS